MHSPFPIVGVCGSAGSFEPLADLCRGLDPALPAAVVVMQHLGEGGEDHLTSLLAERSRLPVENAQDGELAEPGRVYVGPAGRVLTIDTGVFRVRRPADPAERFGIFDLFLRSLASASGAAACAVILSGAGHDGAAGLRAIEEAGGFGLVQDPAGASHPEMPRAALAACPSVRSLPVEGMPDALAVRLRAVQAAQRDAPPEPPLTEAQLEAICAVLAAGTGHDLSRYKRGTLSRRIRRRVDATGAGDAERYLALLRESPAEIDLLLAELLIGVTRFFRDPAVFDALAKEVVPLLLSGPSSEPVRAWVPGCSSGQEPYSIAILLLEHMAKTGHRRPIQVFASDIDAEALDVARRGVYPAAIEEDVSPARLGAWFVHEGTGYRVTPELRETCIFSRHDLIRDPPFSRIDLVSCRNLLIYLDATLQRRVLGVLHYALRPGGYLVLGPSEQAGPPASLFREVDRPLRIYRRADEAAGVGEAVPPARAAAMQARAADLRPAPTRRGARSHPDALDAFERVLLHEYAPAAHAGGR